MKTNTTHFILVMIVLPLLLLHYEVDAKTRNNTESNMKLICHDELMSVYVSKEQFAGLPFTIYVQDDHRGYYQVTAVAKQCNYFLEETDSFIILTVGSHACFVKRQNNITNLKVAIMAVADTGRVKVVKTITLICEKKNPEKSANENPLVSSDFFCSRDGFNITIPKGATVPPLDLNSLWIPSSQNQNCKAKTRSEDSVTFSFSFTDCGARSTITDGILTYWVNVEVKQQQHGSIFYHTPFRLTVQCSFALVQSTQLGLNVHGKKSEYLSTLKSEGVLRTEMRFAKDPSYRSFYSSHKAPAVIELGKPVYVEVFIVKHEDADLTLLLDDCWATPTDNPHEQQRWNLLVKGCPSSADGYRTDVLKVVSSKEMKYPSLHKRFVVKLFSFVKPATPENLVYFHCNVEICKGPHCFQSCSKGMQKFKRITPGPEQQKLYSTVSGGPIRYLL